jgi:hypothetical protein
MVCLSHGASRFAKPLWQVSVVQCESGAMVCTRGKFGGSQPNARTIDLWLRVDTAALRCHLRDGLCVELASAAVGCPVCACLCLALPTAAVGCPVRDGLCVELATAAAGSLVYCMVFSA